VINTVDIVCLANVSRRTVNVKAVRMDLSDLTVHRHVMKRTAYHQFAIVREQLAVNVLKALGVRCAK
jgi:hypothetical protein